jgi:glyoxylase I family protein
VRGIHHIAVATHDPMGLAKFYEETLSLEQVSVHRYDDGRVRSVWLGLGADTLLMLERADAGENSAPAAEPFGHKRPGLHLIALRIGAHERAGWLARLDSLVENTSGFTIYLRDSEGNRIGLSHYPEPIPASE